VPAGVAAFAGLDQFLEARRCAAQRS